ncbi:hypothetical protein P4O66_001735 [Electrophorus voltai]|uniref:Uncharacterized protein n=1 Tax=Electrophorus voltai TaxID=2609070 RepID=A0AAD8Z803_9TELE|nr:hypothetical protein P4O66_001735 [Electrophorus voltai]
MGPSQAVKLSSFNWRGEFVQLSLFFTEWPSVHGALASVPDGSVMEEAQRMAEALQVAHPPGYPLFTMLASLVLHLLPATSPAHSVAVLCALLGGMASGALCYTVCRPLCNSKPSAASGSPAPIADDKQPSFSVFHEMPRSQLHKSRSQVVLKRTPPILASPISAAPARARAPAKSRWAQRCVCQLISQLAGLQSSPGSLGLCSSKRASPYGCERTFLGVGALPPPLPLDAPLRRQLRRDISAVCL